MAADQIGAVAGLAGSIAAGDPLAGMDAAGLQTSAAAQNAAVVIEPALDCGIDGQAK